MGRWFVVLAVAVCSGCTTAAPSAPTAPTVAPAPPTTAPAKPAAVVSSPSASPSPSAASSPSPAAKPIAAASPSPPSKPSAVQALPTVEGSRPPSSAAFLTPAELDLEFAEPITSRDELQKLVDGMTELNGITHVASDGVHVSFEYDSTQVLPARIRDRLDELGHPAEAGTEVQNPGDTAD